MKDSINLSNLKKFSKNFKSSKTSSLSRNAIIRNDINNVAELLRDRINFKMKLLKNFVLFFIILNFAQISLAENNVELKNKISKNIRCLICQGQSVYDTQSDFAISIKLIIEKKLDEGLNENEIYEFLKNQ